MSRLSFICLLTCACLLPSLVAAGTLTFDLTEPGTVECASVYQWPPATFEIIPIPANHACTGSCFPGSDNNLLWLYPAALQMTFPASTGVVDVEVDLSEADPSLTATASLAYDDGQIVVDVSVASSTGAQTLMLNSEGEAVDTVVVACCECSITEIRLSGPTIVGANVQSWSALKARY